MEAQDGGRARAGRDTRQLLPWAQGRDLWTAWGKALYNPLSVRRDLRPPKEKGPAQSCIMMLMLIMIVIIVIVQPSSQVVKGVRSGAKEPRFES